VLNRDDLVDLIMEHLKRGASPRRAGAEEGKTAAAPEAKGRVFLSEYEIKRMLTPGVSELKIPKDSILSPLASDWLVLRGIKVVRQ
jgi:hypothetical protein